MCKHFVPLAQAASTSFSSYHKLLLTLISGCTRYCLVTLTVPVLKMSHQVLPSWFKIAKYE